MDIQKLMKQAQEMQQKMNAMQKNISAKIYEGKSGAGMVTIQMSGNGEMKKIALDSSLLNIEEKEMLEDLIIAAHNDAKAKADEDSKHTMSKAFGDLDDLPMGLKF